MAPVQYSFYLISQEYSAYTNQHMDPPVNVYWGNLATGIRLLNVWSLPVSRMSLQSGGCISECNSDRETSLAGSIIVLILFPLSWCGLYGQSEGALWEYRYRIADNVGLVQWLYPPAGLLSIGVVWVAVGASVKAGRRRERGERGERATLQGLRMVHHGPDPLHTGGAWFRPREDATLCPSRNG